MPRRGTTASARGPCPCRQRPSRRTAATAEGKVTVDISRLAPGGTARVVFRLVNNDSDGRTTVCIDDDDVPDVTPAISGAFQVAERAAYTVSLEARGPAAAAVTGLEVDRGDGSPREAFPAGTTSATHAYPDGPNPDTLQAFATDGTRTYNSNRLGLDVRGVAPALTASGAASATTGEPCALASAGPGADTTTHWTIDWGDGAPAHVVNGNPSAVTHVFADGAATQVVTATATVRRSRSSA